MTEKRMLRQMAKLRARGAREYSSSEGHRIIYRDGFTDGWEARDDIAREALAGERERSRKL